MGTTYYIEDGQGRITSHAQFKFQDGCKTTTKKVVMGIDEFYYIEGKEPPLPEPTIFERIAEAQAPFIEEQALAKKEYVTADIEGDEEWKAEAQAEYQASIVAMKEAAEQARGGE